MDGQEVVDECPVELEGGLDSLQALRLADGAFLCSNRNASARRSAASAAEAGVRAERTQPGRDAGATRSDVHTRDPRADTRTDAATLTR